MTTPGPAGWRTRWRLTKSTVDAPSFGAAARERGVLVSVLGPRVGRLVTHLDVDDAGIDRAIEVLTGLLSG
jgi:threonine aldolase